MYINRRISKRRRVLVLAILLGGVVTGFYGASFVDALSALREKAASLPEIQIVTEQSIKPVATDDDKPVVLSAAYKMIDKTIREELRQGRPTYALKLLGSDPMAKKIKNSEYDQLRASIAQSYLTEGLTRRAYEVASVSARRSKTEAPHAAWVGGIAAWKLHNYRHAADLFGTVADSKRSSAWLKSSGAFWASRAYNRIGQPSKADRYLDIAAEYPRTFYGLIALRSQGRDYDFNWDKPDLKSKHKKSLENSPAVQEAVRLSKNGKMADALAQLGKSGWLDGGLKQEQLLGYILGEDAPALALHLGRQTKNKHGEFYDVALYPEAPWDPAKGYEVDRALVNALIRQESRFNPQAVSSSGARGLMQLMPSTASYMAKGIDVSLTHPETNISVGQQYVRHLLMDPSVNNDLFYMAIAYNAGPGNLARWKKQLKGVNDPLLFIESIPSAETRAFVERVMVNYWIYRIRMGKDNPSLDAVASGERSQYTEAGTRHDVLEFAQN